MATYAWTIQCHSTVTPMYRVHSSDRNGPNASLGVFPHHTRSESYALKEELWCLQTRFFGMRVVAITVSAACDLDCILVRGLSCGGLGLGFRLTKDQ
ncbi:hypothetical protein N7486_003890 [Penicillium sp. IBT 16267x]|nr:hypothetical protein N7486_003890 [Penicillium sp. IBT 16267x]